MNENITVLLDESLGGVLREYREVKRRAHVGERVKTTGKSGHEPYKIGEILTVIKRWGDYVCFEEYDFGARDFTEYVVLEPTDIVYVDDTDGVSRKYRMVDREAAVGERVIIVNEGSESFGGHYYRIGNVGTVTVGANIRKNIRVDFSENDEYHGDGRWIVSPGDYRVLEPVEETPLSTQPAADQIAENIANLQAQIKALESRVAALEDSARPCVKVASGPVDRTPPDPTLLPTIKPGDKVRIISASAREWIGREAVVTEVYTEPFLHFSLDIGGGHWTPSCLEVIESD